MAFQILLNFLIAFVWMFLNTSFSAQTFITGYLIGMLIIFSMRRYFKGMYYLKRVWAVIKLVFIFMRELILSNIAVFRIVIRPKMDIKPNIFAFHTDLKHDWEITLLSSLITLTPGTLVVHVSDDQKTLYIHAIHADEVKEEIESIKSSFEKAIKEVGLS